MIPVAVHVDLGLLPEELAAAVQRGHERAVVEIAAWLKARVIECINTGTDPWGEAWAPLDPDTRSPTGRIGVRSGAMLASITATPEAPTSGVTTAEVHIGAQYSAYFQGSRALLPLVWQRRVNDRGRRLKSRTARGDMPEAWTQAIVAIDERHVMASIEEAAGVARARQDAAMRAAASAIHTR